MCLPGSGSLRCSGREGPSGGAEAFDRGEGLHERRCLGSVEHVWVEVRDEIREALRAGPGIGEGIVEARGAGGSRAGADLVGLSVNVTLRC